MCDVVGMEHLWAPWRKAYVQTTAGTLSEVFSEIARSTEDEKNHVLLRGKACFAVLNAFPYNTGHCLVIPYKVTGEIEELADDELHETLAVLKKMKAAITAAFQPQGYNVGLNLGAAAGAGIAQHLHWHLVPRWRQDSNFMTTTANTRIHPSDLDEVYRVLKSQLAN
jgi:ATP adenylyltransferase